ncbi:DNA mismatch repair protein MutL [Sporobacter termitidis DSM 10068]|uniref:DNA mismatch repair protein MutL n=1 Tax=Sporobacter termitidis DSM 10068 TaxID=1123282 RepID=A0A1M5Z797_9FIRM|nr:DNA mismatch repair endonuclease MutL [Sporobacter termitidis]SHI20126.1 DNA mismatch repair protein MutL [Sporobacter termitidis DSM 10068]
MAKILQLDAHVADLIAAGEVVERPASVIKELIENSIDSGATMVTVEIKGGGMTYMRVTDNGCGIAPEDTETAFLRHATSKLRDEKGLEAIMTLGFRGEALAAIAAVSRVELLTRETGAETGTSLSVEGGAVKARELAGCPEGTTMIVRDLFYNTPARLKFMKTDRAEGAGVSAQVISSALSHPEVSVRYIKDGKEECHTPGDGRIDSCIYSLFGREFAGGLLKAATSDDAVTVSGFVSTPVSARGNRSYQFFFVNGRIVKSKTLQAALEQAYKNSLFTGRFPSCVLYITLSPSQVDVNVHPTKTEVKFLNEHQVFDGVYYAALSALESEGRKDAFRISESTKSLFQTEAAEAPAERPSGGAPARTQSPYGGGGFISRVPSVREFKTYAPVRDETALSYKTAADKIPPAAEAGPKTPAAWERVGEPAGEEPAQTEIDMSRPEEIAEMPPAKRWRVVGEALDTYILAEQGDSLWLIDKHAAHERIHFDRLKSEKQVTMSQTLLDPVVCNLGSEDTALLVEKAALLSRLGFQLDAFGDAAVAVRELPADIDAAETEGLLGELADILRRGGSPDEGAVLDELRHSVACKAAIKAGRRSEPLELEALVDKVLTGEVRYCPHGRPVATELTKAALDRTFKRT